MKRGRRHIVGIDLETGGFEPGRHSILAIGAYFDFSPPGAASNYLRTLRIYVEREPDTEVHEAAARKCGWQSDEQWRAKGALPLATALDMFRLWLMEVSDKVRTAEESRCSDEGPWLEPLAHHCEGVDRPFLDYWTRRCDLWEAFFGAEAGLLSRSWHDSMHTLRACQAAGIASGLSSSLDALVLATGLRKLPWPHDPLEDALAAYCGYRTLIGLMRRGKDRPPPANEVCNTFPRGGQSAPAAINQGACANAPLNNALPEMPPVSGGARGGDLRGGVQ